MAIFASYALVQLTQGQSELPFLHAFRQRYTTDQSASHRICFASNELRVEVEGHVNAPSWIE
jgi:hypothetical protein